MTALAFRAIDLLSAKGNAAAHAFVRDTNSSGALDIEFTIVADRAIFLEGNARGNSLGDHAGKAGLTRRVDATNARTCRWAIGAEAHAPLSGGAVLGKIALVLRRWGAPAQKKGSECEDEESRTRDH